jgi:hypothetical protein
MSERKILGRFIVMDPAVQGGEPSLAWIETTTGATGVIGAIAWSFSMCPEAKRQPTCAYC